MRVRVRVRVRGCVRVCGCVCVCVIIVLVSCNMFPYQQSETKYGSPQTKPKHDLFVEALSYLDPLIRLTVTEIKDFVFSREL